MSPRDADETRHSSNSGSQQGMTATDQEPALTPLPSPRLVANQIEVVSEPLVEDPQAPFASSPPPLAQDTLRRPDLIDLQTRSSSPLSSPPPVTFDPYEESLGTSSSSSNQDSASSRSQSEEPSSVSTPLLTSQTSFSSSSGRASLPNMKGRDLFDAQIWSCPIKTSVFYTFATTLRQKVRCAEPTSSHHFVSILRDSRKLVRCYTQNIDQLEERVGLTTSLSLGAGNRYRFSARAGRKLDGLRSSLKNAESSIDSTQGASLKEEEQQGGTQSQEKPQHSRMVVEPSQAEGKDAPSSTAQASQSGSESGSAQNDIPTSAPSTQTAVSAPPAPNRGVECVFLHGSLAELRCFVCARTASWDDETRQADTLAGRQPICPHCAGATAAREERGKRALGVGKLRPDIVLYGEEHPHAHLISPLVQHDLSLGPDMLLILGTSMRVHGLKVLVREFAKAVHDRGGKVVFVNFTKPPESVWADVIDFWVQWDCDAWVGDLQTRKPSLWLPPGATLPDDDKPKHAKASRRQNGEASKRDGVDKPYRRGRESDGTSRNQKRESSGLSVAQETEKDGLSARSQEMPPPPPPPPKVVSNKPIRVPRERKLNPNAKRPASVRDHKLNGAYLVWKILQDLRRITDGNPTSSATNSPSGTSAKPKPKRSRKSAPAVIESVDVKTEQIITTDPTGATEPNTPAFTAVPRSPDIAVETVISNEESSISAAVKSRKRKQTVTWRMINGVETRVSLNDAGDEVPSPLPHTNATFRPSPQPQSQPQPEAHNFRTLPRPTPTASLPAAAPPPPRPVPRADHNATPTCATNAFSTIDSGFRETDRLIAQLHQESSAVFMPRPSTPPVRLAPLNMHPASGPVPHTLRQGTSPKLATLEPKVTSPGPQAAISCDVGSPVAITAAAAAAASHARMQLGGVTDPFSLADPLAGWLSFPPRWMEQQGQQQGQGQGRVGYEREWYPHRHAVGCGPDEQLRKEQEAALMLSALREGSRG